MDFLGRADHLLRGRGPHQFLHRVLFRLEGTHLPAHPPLLVRHYAGYNAAATGVFFFKLLVMQGFHLLLVALGWFQDKSYEPALCNLLALCISGFFSFVLNEFVVFRIKKK